MKLRPHPGIKIEFCLWIKWEIFSWINAWNFAGSSWSKFDQPLILPLYCADSECLKRPRNELLLVLKSYRMKLRVRQISDLTELSSRQWKNSSKLIFVRNVTDLSHSAHLPCPTPSFTLPVYSSLWSLFFFTDVHSISTRTCLATLKAVWQNPGPPRSYNFDAVNPQLKSKSWRSNGFTCHHSQETTLFQTGPFYRNLDLNSKSNVTQV